MQAARGSHGPGMERGRESGLTREVRTAPTLVKYAVANQYLMQTRTDLEQAAGELLGGMAIAASPLVDLVERTETLEV